MTGALAGITGPGTAFIAGLVTSLHCVGMCGPLACALMPAARNDADPQVVATTYHLTRLAGYTLLGAVAGGVGQIPFTLAASRVFYRDCFSTRSALAASAVLGAGLCGLTDAIASGFAHPGGGRTRGRHALAALWPTLFSALTGPFLRHRSARGRNFVSVWPRDGPVALVGPS